MLQTVGRTKMFALKWLVGMKHFLSYFYAMYLNEFLGAQISGVDQKIQISLLNLMPDACNLLSGHMTPLIQFS